jgi:predicted aminopeptidase
MAGKKGVMQKTSWWQNRKLGLSLWAFVAAVAAPVLLTGCATPIYLAKLGWGQARIILHTKPNDSVLDDPRVDLDIKEKIRLILETKTYGEEEIGLAKTSNFLGFYQVKGPCLVYVVSACPKDRLKSHQWWFPITGKVTTKGFFHGKEAQREKEKLERKGLDVFVQGAQAYSTLGWFKDPIFSTMLDQNPVLIMNVVLHELTHATVFFRDELDFNEQIANFVGCQGAVDFSGKKFGPGSSAQKWARGVMDDGVLFARFVRRVCQRLSELYARPLSAVVKRQEREEIFLEAKEDFKALRAQFKTSFYRGFEEVRLNNAAVLAMARYVANIELIQSVHEKLGKDLEKTVAFFKQMKAEGVSDPHGYVATWLGERDPKEAASVHEDDE